MRRKLAAVGIGILALGLTGAPGIGAAEEEAPAGPVATALEDLRAHPGRYGVTGADVTDVAVTDAYRSDHTGVTHVYVRQRIHGLEVIGANATINVTEDGDILHIGSRLIGGLGDAASGRPTLSAVQAVAAAAGHLDLGAPQDLRVLRREEGRAQATLLSEGGISLAPIPAVLAYQPAAGQVRLAWRLEIQEVDQQHWWMASIDAETGTLLDRADLVDQDAAEDISAATARAVPGRDARPATGPSDAVPDGSSYRVYARPLESPNDGDRTLVENPADALASPWGWHDTNGAAGPEHLFTQGNNVHAYLDTTSTGSVGLPLPGTDAFGGEGLDFDYPLVLEAPPTANFPAAVTNLFYWNNVVHDVFYRYGFDEASGNFQVNNYGRGGLGNDDVQAEAQDGSGVNNANFATPVDGSQPRMQMYVWTPSTSGDPSKGIIRDGDFESSIITHEYGHGISNRLTGGPNTGGCLGHQEREGEGWSDWLALALTTLPGENGVTPRGMGPYVLGQPNRQGAGIRPTRYSTNMSVNGSTYDDVKTLAVPHGVGYVWATMLWEVYWDLIAKHGFNPNVYEDWTTGGNNLAIQLVLDGMKLQPCSPGFADARNAILAADVALTEGENQCLIWRGFAKRGLGYSASQGSPTSRSDGTEAFDTHPDCRASARTSPESLSATVPSGGQAQATLTIANGALADGQTLDWTIVEGAADCSAVASYGWLSVDPLSGSTAPAGTSEVIVSFDGSGLPAGSEHAGTLCVSSNGEGPAPAVQVSLSVT